MNDNKNKRTVSSRSFEKQFPILRGFRVGNLVAAHCPWCDRMHVHGWPREDSARDTILRYAHCDHQPPAPSSYRVSVFREKDLQRVGYFPAGQDKGAKNVKQES